MEILQVVLQVLLGLTSILLTLLILLHKGRGGGLSDMFGGGVTSNLGASGVAERNLNRVTVDSVRAGLTSAQALDVTTQAADGVADEVRVTAWAFAPSVVLRDGSVSSSWSYDPASDTVALLESDPAAHTWTLIP